jgi:hypothetical protein
MARPHFSRALNTLCVQSHPVSSLTGCPVTPCFQSHTVSSHTLFPVSQGVRSHPVSSLTGCSVTPCFQSHRVSSHTLFPVSQGVQSHLVSSLTGCPVCPSHCDRVCACQVCAAVPVLCVLTGCGDFSAARLAPAQAAGSSPTQGDTQPQ